MTTAGPRSALSVLPRAQDIMVGSEASEHRTLLQISYPVENGIVTNWDDMEHLWNHTFGDKLGVAVKVCILGRGRRPPPPQPALAPAKPRG